MANEDLEPEDIERKVLSLSKAMEKNRSAQADRDDVIVEMKHAKLGRLELLAEDLAPVFNELPTDNDQFEFALTNGETPRLWIDMTSFVRMAADGRDYEFVKDTRLGRTILGRTSKRDQIGEIIAAYVAERVLERERMIEGDWISAKALLGEKQPDDGKAEQENTPTDSSTAETESQQSSVENNPRSGFMWFFVGIAAGFAALWIAVELDQIEPIMGWLQQLTGAGASGAN